ncbi:hypothetical protein SmJEL517_g02022 [Synchytrium microbalum]|uniref:Uncharacterized protein n=1 Tax=Synchytrium microbalum TaxID=1806994 RepID=A0A507CDU9_9FUNG|nr:uncharacterized protein SmJEL517_g02022 [Synchytrium microbalum]TPX35745.1 hypothetical protein SmJEL517_g02022 [Synchytrium microbalum]
MREDHGNMAEIARTTRCALSRLAKAGGALERKIHLLQHTPIKMSDSTLELMAVFAVSKPQTWQSEFDQILESIAETCQTDGIPWTSLKELIRYKIKQNVHAEDKMGRVNGLFNKGDTVSDYEERIDQALDSFEEPPFTIQRICELITNPDQHHRNVWAYLRALEKVLLVTSTELDHQVVPSSSATSSPLPTAASMETGSSVMSQPTLPATQEGDPMIMSPPRVGELPPEVVALGPNPVASPFASLVRPATPPVGGDMGDPMDTD